MSTSYDRTRTTSQRALGRKPISSPTPIQQRNTYAPVSRPADISPDQLAEIKEAFDIFDADHDGALDYHELKVAMRALGFDTKKQDVLKIIKDNDVRQRHLLLYEDFTRIMTEKITSRDPLDEIRRAFKLFDDEEKGTISLRNLKRVAKELNESIDEQELEAMIEEFDLDGDGEISLDEFIAIMRDEQ